MTTVSDVVWFVYTVRCADGSLYTGITTDVSGLVQTGVVVGAALATGGLSLFAQGLRDRTIANAQVCQLAIEDDGTDPVLHEKTEPEK